MKFTRAGKPVNFVLGTLRPYLPLVAVCALLGALGGVGVASLLATVNEGLHARDGGHLLVAFVGFCLLALVGSIGADIGTNLVGQRVVAVLRKALVARILSAPIDALESFRAHRLVPVLGHDVETISNFAFELSSFATALAVVSGCFIYLAVLSPTMFVIVALAAAAGASAQAVAQRRSIKGFLAVRDNEDRLQKHYREIADGAKELRLNRGRRRRSIASVAALIGRTRDAQILAITLFAVARGFGTVLVFATIGLTLALRQLGWPEIDPAETTAFVLVLLYMRGPADQLIGLLPAFGRAFVALRRIADLAQCFATPEPGLLASLETSDIGDPVATSPAIRSIALRGATYAFPAATAGTPFVLGPLDFSVQAGEIVFVVGENGSGKTTLVKLLLALYEPTTGVLQLDGAPVAPEARDAYRQLFTTVLSDYHLFENLADDSVPLEAERYLERLEIAHKVAVVDGALTTVDLSTGQRKRLALLQAWLEGRPVLIFDEWAADQDPRFRRIFYEELLPDLKRRGKTIVVISHDDRYFAVADRVVRLADGRITADDAPDFRGAKQGC